jgi:hypothetical protein
LPFINIEGGTIMADKDLEITKESSFPRRDIDMANASENFSDLGDKTSGGQGPQPSQTVRPDEDEEVKS